MKTCPLCHGAVIVDEEGDWCPCLEERCGPVSAEKFKAVVQDRDLWRNRAERAEEAIRVHALACRPAATPGVCSGHGCHVDEGLWSVIEVDGAA